MTTKATLYMILAHSGVVAASVENPTFVPRVDEFVQLVYDATGRPVRYRVQSVSHEYSRHSMTITVMLG